MSKQLHIQLIDYTSIEPVHRHRAILTHLKMASEILIQTAILQSFYCRDGDIDEIHFTIWTKPDTLTPVRHGHIPRSHMREADYYRDFVGYSTLKEVKIHRHPERLPSLLDRLYQDSIVGFFALFDPDTVDLTQKPSLTISSP